MRKLKTSGDFSVGDVVRLKSGGPNMTINEIRTFEADASKVFIDCVWFAGKKHETATFDPLTIEPVPNKP